RNLATMKISAGSTTPRAPRRSLPPPGDVQNQPGSHDMVRLPPRRGWPPPSDVHVAAGWKHRPTRTSRVVTRDRGTPSGCEHGPVGASPTVQIRRDVTYRKN